MLVLPETGPGATVAVPSVSVGPFTFSKPHVLVTVMLYAPPVVAVYVDAVAPDIGEPFRFHW